jgi:hypothetical protein
MADEAVVERLDLLISTIKLAFANEIVAARDDVRTDPVSAAILDATAEGAVRSGELQAKVASEISVNARTVRRRIHELISLGALRQVSAGPTTYSNTGLV